MTDAVSVESTVVVTPAKSKRGAKVNPDSKASQTRRILASIPASELTRARALVELEKQLGLSKPVASVYYYNYKPKSDADAGATVG